MENHTGQGWYVDYHYQQLVAYQLFFLKFNTFQQHVHTKHEHCAILKPPRDKDREQTSSLVKTQAVVFGLGKAECDCYTV